MSVFKRLVSGAMAGAGGFLVTAAHAELAVVLNAGEGTISLIDKASMTETRRFPIGKQPHHLLATPDDKLLIVANAASDELVFLDPLSGEIKWRLEKISDPIRSHFDELIAGLKAKGLCFARITDHPHWHK